jgi:hypothetical protein
VIYINEESILSCFYVCTTDEENEWQGIGDALYVQMLGWA